VGLETQPQKSSFLRNPGGTQNPHGVVAPIRKKTFVCKEDEVAEGWKELYNYFFY
jgi:hypothetical protein